VKRPRKALFPQATRAVLDQTAARRHCGARLDAGALKRNFDAAAPHCLSA
jgi:hypothetical protein